MSTRRRTLPGILAAALAGALLLLLGPWPAGADDGSALYDRVAEAITPGERRNLGIAEIRGDDVTFAGSDPDREFEIGSVSKTFTTSLLADAIERGELADETTLGEVFARASLSGDVAMISVAELASHRSGLPRVAPTGSPAALTWTLTNNDPYTDSPDALLAALDGLTLEGRGTVQYSNYGMTLLGMALEEVTGTPYPTLLDERIFTPLGMDASYAPVTPEGLREGAPTGLTLGLVGAQAWTMGPAAPAGGIRSTPRDMAVYLQAYLDGTAPGAAAAEPRFDAGEGQEIGLGWFTLTEDPAIAFHNGMTGGFAAIAGFRPDTDAAILVLSDVALDVDGALTLLEGP